ncbi:MAG TPA: hypothetical protein VFL93_13100 [Longimicrobiaceae bacterium]|nr:hypothetical protein [Longimicrobiaceae bacterium]
MRESGSSGGAEGNFEKIGEGVGGLAGQAADTGMNFLNSVFGNAVDSMGGWWSRASRQQDSSSGFGERQDRECRRHFEATLQGEATDEGGFRAGGEMRTGSRSTSEDPRGGGGRDYEDVRPMYQLGDVAAQNPDYQDRSFEEIEPELRGGWGEEQSSRYGAWPDVRGFVEFGYSQHAKHRDE